MKFFIFLTSICFGISAYSNEQIKELLQQQMWLQGVGSQRLYSTLGPEVVSHTQKFIENPANKKALMTAQGRQLIKNHRQIFNYNQIRKAFKKCQNDGSKRNLTTRILDAAFVEKELTINCPRGAVTEAEINSVLNNLNGQIKDIQKISDHYTQKDTKELLNQLLEQSLINSAKTHVNIRYQFEKGFALDGNLTKDELAQSIKEICGKKNCSSSQKERLKNAIIQEVKLSKEKQKKYSSPTQTARLLKEKVKHINKTVKDVKLDAEQGLIKTMFWDSSDVKKEDKENLHKLENYVQTYTQEATSGPGILLLTDHMKEKIGHMRQLEDEDLWEIKNKKQTYFKFKSHKTNIRSEDIDTAKNEILNKVQKQIRKLAVIKQKSKRQLYHPLKDLIASNPAAVGQILIKNPHLSPIVCDMINKIEQEDDAKKNTEAWLWGGLVVGAGIAIVVASGGTALAGALIAKGIILKGLTATAAASAAGTLTTISTAGLVSGMALGALETAHYSADTLERYNEMRDMELAYLTGNSDRLSIVEARENLTAFKEARLRAALSLGFSVTDLGGLKLLKASQAGTKAAKAQQSLLNSLSQTDMKNFTKTYKQFAQGKAAKILFEAGKKMGKDGGRNIDEFLLLLSKTKPTTRDKLLLKLQTGQLSPQQLKELIENSLTKGKNTRKAC